MELTIIDDSVGFDFSELKSIEAVRKALLEKEREKLLDEPGQTGLFDGEKLKLSKATYSGLQPLSSWSPATLSFLPRVSPVPPWGEGVGHWTSSCDSRPSSLLPKGSFAAAKSDCTFALIRSRTPYSDLNAVRKLSNVTVTAYWIAGVILW